MKTQLIRILMLSGCACLVAPLAAQENNRASGQNASTTAHQQKPASNAERVRVTRATHFLGSDVIATDGRKVGDIVDYYFNLGDAPHLAYIVVMTGGFLDMGGDRRAVPATAISLADDTCRLNISSERFWNVPVLPDARDGYLADPQNRNRISQFFSSPERPAGGSQASDANRAGAPTGRTGAQREQRLVSFDELRNADAYGAQDNRLGTFVDAWINVNDNRAPYVEITPTFQPFRTSYDRRYAIPTAKLEQKREYYGYNVGVKWEELDKAQPVSETQGIKMLQDGEIGNMVLRVTVPKN